MYLQLFSTFRKELFVNGKFITKKFPFSETSVKKPVKTQKAE